MDRNEILEKSRNEGSDEGMTNAQNKGRRLGWSAFCLVEIVVLGFNLCLGASNFLPLAFFWAFAAAEAYPMYCFTQKRRYLTTVILGGVFSVFCVICYILSALGRI